MNPYSDAQLKLKNLAYDLQNEFIAHGVEATVTVNLFANGGEILISMTESEPTTDVTPTTTKKK